MIDHGLKLYEDGTLQITMPKGTMVRRVLVGEEGSHFCEVMYPETGSGISKEPTYEQVMEYCKKRCLSLVSEEFLTKLPSTLPEPKEIGYVYCSSALLKMWMDNVLTDGEYNRIMERLNAKDVEDMRGDKK